MTSDLFITRNDTRPRVWFCMALIATIFIYWRGLSGPFVLDDESTFLAIAAWQQGQQGWLQTLLPNSGSLIDSRPLAMASFMFSAWLGGGVESFPFKLGNLVLHLMCGLLGWWVLRDLLRRDARLSAHAELLATIAATLWLLHPLHVSTVLYAVQRMAQLATLFTLAAVAIYLIARRQLIAGRLRPAVLNLFIAFPLLMGLGVLGKQNAAIAGFLCLALELAYFQGQAQHRRVLQVFFGLFIALPLLAVAGILALAPDRLLAGYADWDFTLGQRLLTQPRALLDYVGMWLLPRGPQMGLYTDGYAVSTGLLSPPTTLLAIATLTAVSVFALAVRKRAPSVFAGWFFFLLAHAVEASFLPLEMYYEHRNYLPSLGLLLMLFGLGSLLGRRFRDTSTRLRSIAIVSTVAIACVLAFSTFSRVRVWQDSGALVAQALEHYPASLRARMDSAVLAMRTKNYTLAGKLNAPLLESESQRDRVAGHMLKIVIDCMASRKAAPADLAIAGRDATTTITVNELQLARMLEMATRSGSCGAVDPGMIADTLVVLLDRSRGQSEASGVRFSTRLLAARLYARSGRWHRAEAQAGTAWEASGYLPAGTFLARAYIHNGKVDEAAETLSAVEAGVRYRDPYALRQIARLRELLAAERQRQ